MKLKPIPFALASLLCVTFVLEAGEPDRAAKDKRDKSVLPVFQKPPGVPAPPDAFMLTDSAHVPARPAIKLAPHVEEPQVKLPEMTIGGKVKPLSKQTEKERYRLPQTTESITREKIDSTINLANTEDAINRMLKFPLMPSATDH